MLSKIILFVLGIVFSFFANDGYNVKLNHKGKIITVNVNSVQKHLDHGDTYISGLPIGGGGGGSDDEAGNF